MRVWNRLVFEHQKNYERKREALTVHAEKILEIIDRELASCSFLSSGQRVYSCLEFFRLDFQDSLFNRVFAHKSV